jgi:hypothetical protein
MKKNSALTSDDLNYISQRESIIDSFLHRMEHAKRFKLNDILIAFVLGDTEKTTPVRNCYGVPKKYKVVFEDKHGIPYAKELSKNGKPTGMLLTLVKWGDHRYDRGEDMFFQLDPDYEDSLIMQDENYDPASSLNKSSSLFAEITKHNKQIRFQFKLENVKKEIAAINKVNVGDTVWRGHNKFWIILDKNSTDGRNLTWKSDHVIFKVQTEKGEIKDITYRNLSGHFYTKQPRSYKNELQNPN